MGNNPAKEFDDLFAQFLVVQQSNGPENTWIELVNKFLSLFQFPTEPVAIPTTLENSIIVAFTRKFKAQVTVLNAFCDLFRQQLESSVSISNSYIVYLQQQKFDQTSFQSFTSSIEPVISRAHLLLQAIEKLLQNVHLFQTLSQDFSIDLFIEQISFVTRFAMFSHENENLESFLQTKFHSLLVLSCTILRSLAVYHETSVQDWCAHFKWTYVMDEGLQKKIQEAQQVNATLFAEHKGFHFAFDIIKAFLPYSLDQPFSKSSLSMISTLIQSFQTHVTHPVMKPLLCNQLRFLLDWLHYEWDFGIRCQCFEWFIAFARLQQKEDFLIQQQIQFEKEQQLLQQSEKESQEEEEEVPRQQKSFPLQVMTIVQDAALKNGILLRHLLFLLQEPKQFDTETTATQMQQQRIHSQQLLLLLCDSIPFTPVAWNSQFVLQLFCNYFPQVITVQELITQWLPHDHQTVQCIWNQETRLYVIQQLEQELLYLEQRRELNSNYEWLPTNDYMLSLPFDDSHLKVGQFYLHILWEQFVVQHDFSILQQQILPLETFLQQDCLDCLLQHHTKDLVIFVKCLQVMNTLLSVSKLYVTHFRTMIYFFTMHPLLQDLLQLFTIHFELHTDSIQQFIQCEGIPILMDGLIKVFLETNSAAAQSLCLQVLHLIHQTLQFPRTKRAIALNRDYIQYLVQLLLLNQSQITTKVLDLLTLLLQDEPIACNTLHETGIHLFLLRNVLTVQQVHFLKQFLPKQFLYPLLPFPLVNLLYKNTKNCEQLWLQMVDTTTEVWNPYFIWNGTMRQQLMDWIHQLNEPFLKQHSLQPQLKYSMPQQEIKFTLLEQTNNNNSNATLQLGGVLLLRYVQHGQLMSPLEDAVGFLQDTCQAMIEQQTNYQLMSLLLQSQIQLMRNQFDFQSEWFIKYPMFPLLQSLLQEQFTRTILPTPVQQPQPQQQMDPFELISIIYDLIATVCEQPEEYAWQNRQLFLDSPHSLFHLSACLRICNSKMELQTAMCNCIANALRIIHSLCFHNHQQFDLILTTQCPSLLFDMALTCVSFTQQQALEKPLDLSIRSLHVLYLLLKTYPQTLLELFVNKGTILSVLWCGVLQEAVKAMVDSSSILLTPSPTSMSKGSKKSEAHFLKQSIYTALKILKLSCQENDRASQFMKHMLQDKLYADLLDSRTSVEDFVVKVEREWNSIEDRNKCEKFVLEQIKSIVIPLLTHTIQQYQQSLTVKTPLQPMLYNWDMDRAVQQWKRERMQK